MAILDAKRIWAVPEGLVLRAEDEAECRAGGMSGREAVRRSIALSVESYEMLRGGERLAVWGWSAESALGVKAKLWLLSCPAMAQNALCVGREARRAVRYLSSIFPILEVSVHAKYVKSIAWLRRLGFQFAGTYITTEGEAFLFMQIRREV